MTDPQTDVQQHQEMQPPPSVDEHGNPVTPPPQPKSPPVPKPVKELTEEERQEQMMARHAGSPVVMKDEEGNAIPPKPTPYHEGATEIGWATVQRYVPPSVELDPPLDPANPPAELVDLCNEVGHQVLARYDDPRTEPVETPVPPDWDPSVPYTLDAYIAKELAKYEEAHAKKNAEPAKEKEAA